ncbi:ATP-dependent DNA helicase RecG [Alkalicoccobacillus murimartini]|uniref:ATP-dependent DNA helicase RecG n=1 Tax=Alkalicoccobacillus murimartini TaxID=171685 RepID=A0ABT9YF90_9BACI|nr:ATP-dependent DNA helicase RecG [Alkalicoccobacillus murimartini]MDQ0206396.1 ATP-dependent DNA helicase RecG [Alkalicoccobacillus murimartini]
MKRSPYERSIIEVHGIGEEKAKLFEGLKLRTVGDLLEYYPFRYEDYKLKDLQTAEHDERVTVTGVIHNEASVRYYGKKKNRLSFRMLVGRLLVTVTFFNRGFLKNQLTLGDEVTISGKWDRHRMTITGTELQKGAIEQDQTIEPVYSASSTVSSKMLKAAITAALKQFGEDLPEPLPEAIRIKYKLMDKQQTVHELHKPSGQDTIKQARRRMVYEEFLYFQLKMQLFRKNQREQNVGRGLMIDSTHIEEFISSLPFSLTKAQHRVIDEVIRDMESPYQMNRLLQGDVGSGKTVVAAACLYGVIRAGYQTALMVPTEILAEQHLESLQAWFEPLGKRVELFSGSLKGKRRKELLADLAEGKIDVAVGTHALIQDDVIYHHLGFAITDEQHRFGVNQRRQLRSKGDHVDVLFMTATPIPRTLAISVFGDMDVSILDEMPAGRKPIETYWAKHDMLERVLGFVEKELKQGRQAYVICPLIEESEMLDVQNAMDVHQILTEFFKSRFQVGLMHGRLASEEKDQVMKAFDENKTQVLVSTTVVEVGVNVPNATMMVIYDADRFGLAQLHQLRGRVGRGSAQSYCVLLSDPKTENGRERMRIMTETNDGFVLSERDLELRGPGDFFGAKQSGLPDFKVADVVHDYRTLEVARQDAAALVESKHFWEDSEYQVLKDYLKQTGALDQGKLD